VRAMRCATCAKRDIHAHRIMWGTGSPPPQEMAPSAGGVRTPPLALVSTSWGGCDPLPRSCSGFRCPPPPQSNLRLLLRNTGPTPLGQCDRSPEQGRPSGAAALPAGHPHPRRGRAAALHALIDRTRIASPRGPQGPWEPRIRRRPWRLRLSTRAGSDDSETALAGVHKVDARRS
jgi:hypothetical protein